YADAGARLRNLLEIGEWDLGSAGGAAGYRFERGRNALRVEYAYDGVWVGAEPFLTSHQVQVDGDVELFGARAGALLTARHETYLALQSPGLAALETDRYTGPSFDGELSLGFGGGKGELRLRYRGERHLSRDPDVSWLDHGPGVRTVAAFAAGRLVVDAQVTSRTYGAVVPEFGDVVRQDTYLDGVVTVEQDVSRQLTLYLSLGGRKAFSNVGSLEYTRLAGSAGAIFTAGLW
ncbi:MAG TPA: hypothetical protein VND93_33870, partial [Myxococcales bacterium]|nr:hypothetical protein [Myxococcales bacterium]